MDKKKIIQITVFAVCIIGAMFLGMLIGKQNQGPKDKEKEPVHNEESENAEKDGDCYILIIDGNETNIGDDLVSAEKGCVMVKDSVITEVLGFAKTVNEETKEVTYVLGMNSFTFYPDKTMYVYNDTAMESKQKCTEENGVYTINVMTIFLDLDLLVNSSDGRMSVSGYYDCFLGFEQDNKGDMTEEETEDNNGSGNENEDTEDKEADKAEEKESAE